MNEKFDAFKRALAFKRPFWWAVTNFTPIVVSNDAKNPTVYRNCIVLPSNFFDDKNFARKLLIFEHTFVSLCPQRSQVYALNDKARLTAFTIAATLKAKHHLRFYNDDAYIAIDGYLRTRKNKSIASLSTENLADEFLPQINAAVAAAGDSGDSDKDDSGDASNSDSTDDSTDDSDPIHAQLQETHDYSPEIHNENYAPKEDDNMISAPNSVSKFSNMSDEAMRVNITRIIAIAENTEKSAGRDTADGQRIVSDLPRPDSAPWWRMLRSLLLDDYKKVLSDWRRESRRIPGLPTIKWSGTPRVWCLVDVSGSISSGTYNIFAGIVDDLLRRRINVFLVTWDASASAPILLKHGDDVRRLVASGGGGTVPDCLVPEIVPQIKRNDWVVMLTDCDWQDHKAFMRFIRSHKRSILLTTRYTIDGFAYVFRVNT